jgi:hypothetical protein
MAKGCVLTSSNQLDLDKLVIVKDTTIHIISKFFKKCQDYTNLIEKMIHIMEGFKKIQVSQQKNLFVNIVVDFEEINFSNIDLEFVKELIKFFDEKYEYIINKIYCKNVTIIFKLFYKLIKPFLGSETTSKLKFIKKGSTKVLDQVPESD